MTIAGARLARLALPLLPRAMEAKRRALDEIAARQRTADEKRNEASRKLVTETQPQAGTPRVQ